MAKKYKLLNEDALIQPAERPFLAALDFGITFGVVWALFTGIMTVLGMNHLVRSFIQFLEIFYPGFERPLGWGDLLLSIVYGLAHGFLFGLLVSYIYNRWRAPFPCGVKLKRPGRITAAAQPVPISAGEGEHPYTIAIIANPVLESKILADDDDLKWRRDPILDFPKLFQAKVACIIGSLASSQILLKDKDLEDNLLDKMRIVTLFDPSLGGIKKQSLMQRIVNLFKPDLNESSSQNFRQKIAGLFKLEQQEKPSAENALCLEADYDIVIEPIQRRYEASNGKVDLEKPEERLLEFLKNYPDAKDPAFYDKDKQQPTVDVVFAVTASETHTRSSALYTIDEKTKDENLKFTFQFKETGKPDFTRYHDLYPKVPGLIALSAWDNRLKTPLHEFAHAMSSTVNGIIHDEYYDDLPKGLSPKDLEGIMPDLLVVNKRHLPKGSDLPQLFGIYTYPLVDEKKEHKFQPDKIIVKPPDFEAFAPVRLSPRVHCTMDISGDENRFDRMIEQFMQDRLEAKMSR